MKIIRRSDNQLVLHLYDFGTAVAMPILSLLLMGVSGFFSLSIWLSSNEFLTCQKTEGDRVNCNHGSSTYIGNGQFPIQSLPPVTQAEYRYTLIKSDRNNCGTYDQHDFLLVFANNTRQILFQRNIVTFDCQRGDKAWIQQQVNAFNTFVTSETKTLKIIQDQRDQDLLLNFLFIIPVSLLGVVGVCIFLFSPLKKTLIFDSSERKLVHLQTTMLHTKTVSYPFSSLRFVEYNIVNDDDGIYYFASIVLDSDDLSLSPTNIKVNSLPIVQEIAQFVGIPVKTIDKHQSK